LLVDLVASPSLSSYTTITTRMMMRSSFLFVGEEEILA